MHPRLLTIPRFDLFGGSLGPFTLHTYGVLLAIAFLVGLWVASRQARRAGLDAGRITDMAVWVLIAGLIGAKLLLVAVDWRYFSRNPRELLSIFQSGGVFYGGLLAGILAAWFYARRYQLPGWPTADVLAPGVVIGQAIGRLGCLVRGLLLGQADAACRGRSPSPTPTPPERSGRRWTRRCTRASSTSRSPRS